MEYIYENVLKVGVYTRANKDTFCVRWRGGGERLKFLSQVEVGLLYFVKYLSPHLPNP